MIKFHHQSTVQKAFCSNCDCSHTLPQAPAIAAAKDLMAHMDQELPTDYLYGEALGKMFGILVCRTPDGKEIILKAFSGQYNGQWKMKGWVPPLFDVEDFNTLNSPVEKQIKALGREAAKTAVDDSNRNTILQERKQLSRQLMRDIHALYRLHNFRGEQCSLSDLFLQGRGIPTGTGDCCAPKLLNYAAIQKLQPLGLAEFYWGKTNRSGSRYEGQFYPACEDKCGPILGFLLCGLTKQH
jgi:hypothetical protein